MGGRLQELFGREAELQTVEDVAGDGVLVIEGEPGVGKSALWETAIADAEAAGAQLLTARPTDTERAFSFAALGELLSGAPLEEIPSPQRAALEVALLLREPGDKPQEAHAVAAGFLSVVRERARAGPVVVAVDDLQWLDPASAGALEFALRRLGEEPVRFLLTQRAGEEVPIDLQRVAGDIRLRRLELGPLSLGALHRLLAERLGQTLARPVLRRVHETSGGNPFFALELGRALQRRSDAPELGALPVPQTLRLLVRERLEGLPAEEHEALLAAAVTMAPSERLLERALGQKIGLEHARASGIVAPGEHEVRFSHPLFAATIRDEAAPALVRSIHARLAEVVSEPEQQARHLAAAGEGPDEGVAAALAEAAKAARGRGATAAAAELAELAFLKTPDADPATRARRAREAGTYYVEAVDGARADALLTASVDLSPPGKERAAALLQLIDNVITSRDTSAKRELAVRALAESDDPEISAQAHWALSWIDFLDLDLEGAVSHVREAAALAREIGDRARELDTVAEIAYYEALLGDPRAEGTFREGRQLEAELGWHRVSFATITFAIIDYWRDELEPARESLERAIEAGSALGQEQTLPAAWVQLARVELRAGRWGDARRYAEEAYELAEQGGFLQLRGAAASVRAALEASSGNVDEARVLLGEAEAAAAATGDRWYSLHNAVVRTNLELSDRSYQAAADAAEAVRAEVERLKIREPGTFPFEGDAIEALVHLARLEEACALVDRLAASTRPRALALAARGAGLVAAARGESERAIQHLEQALIEHERFTDPLETARTELELGMALRRGKRRKDARGVLESAAETFEELGAVVWAAQARDEIGRLGGRTRTGGLTPAEQKVAELVSEGMSNKEAAAALVVSVGTVEAHLTRIYAKLGVRSRAELVRHVALKAAG